MLCAYRHNIVLIQLIYEETKKERNYKGNKNALKKYLSSFDLSQIYLTDCIKWLHQNGERIATPRRKATSWIGKEYPLQLLGGDIDGSSLQSVKQILREIEQAVKKR